MQQSLRWGKEIEVYLLWGRDSRHTEDQDMVALLEEGDTDGHHRGAWGDMAHLQVVEEDMAHLQVV